MRLLIIAVALLAFGCSKAPEGEQTAGGQSNAASQSTAQQVIEGMTGYTDVKAGQRAKKTVQQIANEKDKDIKDALNDK